MRKKTLLSIASICIIIIFSCRKDIMQDINDEQTKPFLTEAKNYYYQEIKKYGITSVKKMALNGATRASGVNTTITPLWYKNYTSQTGTNSFVEVPIAVGIKQISLYNFDKSIPDKKQDLIRANSSLQRLLIYKTKTGKLHQARLTYLPDYDYLEKNHFDASATQITKMDNYSGYLEFSPINGGGKWFLLQFRNGKMIKKRYARKENKSSTSNIKSNAQLSRTTGRISLSIKDKLVSGGYYDYQCTDVMGQVCAGGGDPYVEECGEWEKVGEDCQDVWVEVPDPENPDDPDNGDPCLDPSNFWMCNPDNPDDPGTEEPPTSDEDPCDRADALENHENFKIMLNVLKNPIILNDNREHGFIYKFGSNGAFSQYPISGQPDLAGIDFTLPNGTVDGIAHTHYDDLLSVFSPDDLMAMTKAYAEGKMSDVNTFTMTLVTADGTQYMLMVDDVTKFSAFATSLNNSNLDNFSLIYGGIYHISPDNTNDQNEKSFLNYIKATNSGLKLFKGNSDFSSWTPKKVEDDNVVNDPCN
ncbi:hypothetical protein ATE47_01580 [Chryseobacterium sp. IHB B 17019]|uniref:hypothetical protein n=1 Tax=Chryseobacterium sp. IHB B 17019 TaxID=1721091 RepID=UPI0007225922|nr:hypothetical protein [Chryseobacterium sp. IHB B 17019]ALR29302.1 hypothetical protein ATE47_01580 [Chryseobacterium sp. IHB B 17019]